MRRLTVLIALALVVCRSVAAEVARTADGFVDSMGVNTHFKGNSTLTDTYTLRDD